MSRVWVGFGLLFCLFLACGDPTSPASEQTTESVPVDSSAEKNENNIEIFADRSEQNATSDTGPESVEVSETTEHSVEGGVKLEHGAEPLMEGGSDESLADTTSPCLTDPDWGKVCTVGQGVCATTGKKVCTADGLALTCDAKEDLSQKAEETCDGKDNNCDGNIDENLSRPCSITAPNPTLVCQGKQLCNNGQWGICTPLPESCDETDDDCNGLINDKLTSCVGTLAGTCGGRGFPCVGGGHQDGVGTAAWFQRPTGITADGQGNIYIADEYNHRIRKIDTTGKVTTVAGTGVPGYKDGPGGQAQFNYPFDVAVDQQGNLYVADWKNYRIRKIDTSGTVSTLAGSGTQGQQNGTATQAQFYGAYGIAIDSTGNVFVADTEVHKIRKIDTSGNVTTFAGTGAAGYVDGPANSAQFDNPMTLRFDSTGNLYVADAFNNKIRKIDTSGKVSTVVTTTNFSIPTGIALDSVGNIYVVDRNSHSIRKIDTSGNVTTLAGTGSAGYNNGTPNTAQFDRPYGIVFAGPKYLVITDRFTHTIRTITLP